MTPRSRGRRSRSSAAEPAPPGPSGHRVRAHTADVIVEAWAPTRVACLSEAVAGLVSAFADVGRARPGEGEQQVEVAVDPGDDEEQLVALLEEVIFVIDVRDAVPVVATLHERADGGISGWLGTVPTASLTDVGAAPKGVSRSDLSFAEEQKGHWACRVEIDV